MSEETAERKPVFLGSESVDKELVGYLQLTTPITAEILLNMAITPVTIIAPEKAPEVTEFQLISRTTIDRRPRQVSAPYAHVGDNPAGSEAEETLSELIREVLPFLRHKPLCPMEKGGGGSCVCGLETTISGIEGLERHLDIVRCQGCSQYAVNGENEDWAYRESDDKHFCNGCALARMGDE